MDNVFIITKEWLQLNKTLRGGYNIKQIEALGLTYPPKKGWQERLIGSELSLDDKASFEYYAVHGNKKARRDGNLVLAQKIKELEREIELLKADRH